MSSLPTSPRQIKVVVFADFVCSFCYIGNEVLKSAIKKCEIESNLKFDIEYRAFQLCTYEHDGETRDAFLQKKMGDRYASIVALIQQMAKQYGISIAHEGIYSDPKLAHRLATKAYKVGGQDLQQKIITSIFEENFGGAYSMDADVLASIAEKHGMMTEGEARLFFESRDCEDAVSASTGFAKKAGIQGVPFFVIENKWALSGVQQEDAFIQIFKKLAQCHAGLASCPPTPALNDMTLSSAATRVEVS